MVSNFKFSNLAKKFSMKLSVEYKTHTTFSRKSYLYKGIEIINFASTRKWILPTQKRIFCLFLLLLLQFDLIDQWREALIIENRNLIKTNIYQMTQIGSTLININFQSKQKQVLIK